MRRLVLWLRQVFCRHTFERTEWTRSYRHLRPYQLLAAYDDASRKALVEAFTTKEEFYILRCTKCGWSFEEDC